jgi:multiple sugar transport system ATP-binding protein
MRDGRVQQIGTPLQVYGKPANKFVAGFIGAPAMNFIDVTVRNEAGAVLVETEGLRLTVGPAEAAALATHNGRKVILGMRPEHLVLGNGAPGLGFDAGVEVVEQLGSEILLETRVGGASVTAARVPAETVIARGDQVRLSAQPGRLHFFDPETELPISR